MPGGRPRAQYSQALRLLKIVEMLQHRRHLTIPQLMAEFAINRRTVQRDVAALTEVYAIEEGERTPDNEKTFRLKPGSRTETLKLTITEMIGLYMGRNLFAFTEGTELKSAVDSLYSKLQTRLSSRNAGIREALPKKIFCTTGFPKSYKRRDEVLNDILTGLIHERKVAITYQPPGKRSYNDVIHPYTLVLHNHALYVHCFSQVVGDRRTLALERIKKSRWREQGDFDYPQDYEPDRTFGAAFGIATGPASGTVRLRFSASVAPYIVARRWHSSMKVKKLKNGSIDLSLRVPISEELLHWVTGYGGEVRVLSPPDLVQAIHDRHAAAMSATRVRRRRGKKPGRKR